MAFLLISMGIVFFFAFKSTYNVKDDKIRHFGFLYLTTLLVATIFLILGFLNGLNHNSYKNRDKILQEAKNMTTTQLMDRMKVDSTFAKIVLNQ